MKNLKGVAAAAMLITGMLGTTNSAFAVSGPQMAAGWNYKNSDDHVIAPNTYYKRADYYGKYTVASGGGDFAVKVVATGQPLSIKLYEEDEAGNPAEYVGERSISGNGWVYFRNIGGYVDGSNGAAEFYITAKSLGSTTEIAEVEYYD